MADVLAAADAAAQAATSHRLAGRRGCALTASGRAQVLAKECGGAASPALAAARVPLPFTPREQEIAGLLSQGLPIRLSRKQCRCRLVGMIVEGVTVQYDSHERTHIVRLTGGAHTTG